MAIDDERALRTPNTPDRPDTRQRKRGSKTLVIVIVAAVTACGVAGFLLLGPSSPRTPCEKAWVEYQSLPSTDTQTYGGIEPTFQNCSTASEWLAAASKHPREDEATLNYVDLHGYCT